MKIVYQGVEGSYSHIAANNIYPNQNYIPCDSFEQAMAMVQNDIADTAIIPVENSNAGRVTDVHFLLAETGLFIVGEYFLRVRHQLLGLPSAEIADIITAASHPQALAQCSNFLREHNISSHSRIDTAKSCENIIKSGDITKAAIASKMAAEIYGLKILASDIENSENNTTRFLIMKKENIIPQDDGKKYITSCIFKVKSIPAALYKALGGFATNGINITKLESYLVGGKFISAQFYIEIESHPNRPEFKNAFEELEFFTEEIHILGTYKASIDRYK